MTRRLNLSLLSLPAFALAIEPEILLLARNGWMPNNARLPLLLYRGVLKGSGLTEKMEKLMAAHGWEPGWRNGVYPFHHYHSTAHEALACSRGEARVIFGGEGGKEIALRAGDIALLPCGTGHCRASASSDFLVSGAYALGQNWDLLRAAPDAEAQQRMKALPFPKDDPIGTALRKYWKD